MEASAEVPANNKPAATAEVANMVVKSFFKLYTPILCESCLVSKYLLRNSMPKSIAGADYFAVSQILRLECRT